MYAFGTHSFNGMKNKIAMYLLLALLAAGLVFCGSAAAANLVPAASSRVKTMGRWIPDENGSLYAGRGAVIASVEFEGTGVQVQMFSDSLGDVWWLKKLDDGPLLRFKSQMGINDLYADLPYGKHTLTIIRETEGMRGVTILSGFYITGEKETADPAAGASAAVTAADTEKNKGEKGSAGISNGEKRKAEKGSTGISEAEKKNRKKQN